MAKVKPQPAKTDNEINALAVQLIRCQIFTSLQIPKRDMHLMPTVFMALAFLDEKQRKEFARSKPGMLYAAMSSAGPLGVNGYPCLMGAIHILSIEDTKRFIAKVRELEKALLGTIEAKS